MDYFKKIDKDNSENIRAIKNWISELYDVPETGIVIVKEIQCPDENCPDIETVILINVGYATNLIKIKKPLIYIRKADIENSKISETTISKS